MADLTSSIVVQTDPRPGIDSPGVKRIYVTISNSDSADTFTVTLSKYSADTFLGITGWVHTTANSIVVRENPTTSVSSGVVTVTIGGSSVTGKKRLYELIVGQGGL
jgi:hypothetical protein